MVWTPGRWTGGTLTARDFLKPHKVAEAVFHPAWIPPSLDPAIDKLKRIRAIAGAVASIGVYTVLVDGFDLTELVENALIASAVLLLLTPVTVGVMLLVWRRTGTLRQLRTPLLNSLALLLLFIGSVVALVLLVQTTNSSGSTLVIIGVGASMMWMLLFVARGAFRVTGNFFGTGAVHRCLPALLATVTSWLVAIPDLVTGDLHGLGLTLGAVFILAAPVTVTGIALLETGRLRRRYGIRLGAHPAGHLPVPGPVPPMPPGAPSGSPYLPPQGNPFASPQGNPYGPPHGTPYVPPQPHLGSGFIPGQGGGSPYPTGTGGNPYAPHNPRGPYSPQAPHHPQGPYNPQTP
ncbi:proline-rich domain-containing protein [Streptomyces albogriseolus]|uniref:proline-rich domain-containing protein n=1 Tax=Streptomyces albogriseolus TaxID=1887 RepID=UPI00378BEAD0